MPRVILKIYSRAFLSQSVGIIGLLWCLFDGHAALGFLLGFLVLADQAFFLQGRFSRAVTKSPFEAGVDLWCLFVGLIDIVLLFAVQLRDSPLRDRLSGAIATDPWNAMSFSLTTFFRLGSDLVPGDPVTRLVASIEALAGSATLLALATALVLWVGTRLRWPTPGT